MFRTINKMDSLGHNSDPVHTGPDPYGHHINLTSFKTSMTLKFVIILQNLIKTYHRKSGKSNCDRKVTKLNVEITRIRSRVNGVSIHHNYHLILSKPYSNQLKPSQAKPTDLILF